MPSLLASVLAFLISDLFAAEIVLVVCLWISYGIYRYSGKYLLKYYHAEKVGLLKKFGNITGRGKVRLYKFNSSLPYIFTVKDGFEYDIALSTGAMAMFDVNEIELLLAREIGHIRNGDVLINTITAFLAGILLSISSVAYRFSSVGIFNKENNPIPELIRFFIVGIVALPAALLIHLMIAPSREYAADGVVEELTGGSDRLPETLRSLESRAELFHRKTNPGHAHLFPVNLLHMKDIYDVYLPMFNTHPDTDNRIDHLMEKGV